MTWRGVVVDDENEYDENEVNEDLMHGEQGENLTHDDQGQ